MKLLFNNLQIQNAINKIATEIWNKHYNDPEPPVMICVLNGAFMFFTDLVRKINIDCEIDFIQVSSYKDNKQQENVIIKDNIKIDLNRKNVYIVDDILDSGNTLKQLISHLEINHKPKSITPVVLFKKESNKWPILHGIELPSNETWLCGYGMDFKGLMRNYEVVFGKINEIE